MGLYTNLDRMLILGLFFFFFFKKTPSVSEWVTQTACTAKIGEVKEEFSMLVDELLKLLSIQKSENLD